MDVNEIINSAMKGGSTMLQDNLFALEGNIPDNSYRILPLSEAYIDAIECFRDGIGTNNVILGIFSSEKGASDFRTMLQTLYRPG